MARLSEIREALRTAPWTLAGRAFRRFIYRRETLVGLVRALDPAPPALRAPRGIVLRRLVAADLADLHPDLARYRRAFAENLERGLECFAAFAGAQAVAVCWYALDAGLDPVRQRFRFARHEIYTFSLYVARPHRGGALAALVQTTAWSHYRAVDAARRYTHLVRLVSLENVAALKVHLHMGFCPDGRGRRDHRLFGWWLTQAIHLPVATVGAEIARRTGRQVPRSAD